MVFSWDLKAAAAAAESIELRLGLSEFQTDGADGYKTDELKRT